MLAHIVANLCLKTCEHWNSTIFAFYWNLNIYIYIYIVNLKVDFLVLLFCTWFCFDGMIGTFVLPIFLIVY
jgi:hypothetical protein